MRKLYLLSAVFTGFLLAACGTTSNNPHNTSSSKSGSTSTSKPQVKNDLDDFVSEKWLDDDTLQVRAVGAPASNAKDSLRRRAQAEMAAELVAQRRVLEMCVGAKINRTFDQDDPSKGHLITKEAEGVVRKGSIVRKSFDGDDNCEITYRVSKKGFKKQCEAIASENDFR